MLLKTCVKLDLLVFTLAHVVHMAETSVVVCGLF